MNFRRIMIGFLGNPPVRWERAKSAWEGFSGPCPEDIPLHPLQRGNRLFLWRLVLPYGLKNFSLFVFLPTLLLETLSLAQVSSENPPLRGAAAAKAAGNVLGPYSRDIPLRPLQRGNSRFS